jgi:preprotein translocase subunit SecB
MELVGSFSFHYSIPLNLCTYIFIPYARDHWIIGSSIEATPKFVDGVISPINVAALYKTKNVFGYKVKTV